jgi:hypothetical protein
MVGSNRVAHIQQFGAFQRTNKLIIKPFFLNLAAHHLLAHLSDAAVKRYRDAELNTPVVRTLVRGVRNRVVP